MSLYESWNDQFHTDMTREEYETFWDSFIPKETQIYEMLLSDTKNVISGKLSELSTKFNVSNVEFIGFLDGINTSLKAQVDLDTCAEDTEITLDVNFETLYFNMLDNKADWLYSLPQWDNILDETVRKEIQKKHRTAKTVVKEEKIGRNDQCPCGSGKKYKKCCGK